MQEDSIQKIVRPPETNRSVNTDGHKKDFVLDNFNVEYDVLSKKYIINDNYFANIPQHIVSLPETNIPCQDKSSDYNPLNKTKIHVEEKPLNIFVPNQIINDIKLSPNIHGKQKLSAEQLISGSIDETSYIYNIFEKREEASTTQGLNFRILPIVDKTDTEETEKVLFNNKIIQRSESQRYNFTDTNWTTISFVGLFVLLAYSRLAFGKFFQQIVKATLVNSSANRIFLEKNLIINRFSILMSIISLAIFAAAITLLFDFLGYNFVKEISDGKVILKSMWYSYAVFTLLIFAIVLVKRIINSFLMVVFDIKNIVAEYRFHSNLYVRISGLVLLIPVMILPYIDVAYVPIIYYIIAFLLLCGYFLRIIRLFSITMRKGFSILFLFLYLCALEFGPLLMLYKLCYNLIM